ncbi:MAG: amylo-alpha-1,6-glucosidase [Candidatus Bathyarchaeia archaeon]
MKLGEMKRRLLENIEKLRSSMGYLNAGYPRYNTLFGRDSLISAWQMLEVDPSIARATLETLARYQGKTVNPRAEEEPGKILHEFRFDPKSQAELPHWDFPYYGSVDSTPLFIIMAGEYFRQTKDETFLLQIWDNILAAFGWIRDYGDKDGDGYLEYERSNPYGLFHQGWKDGVQDHLRIKPPVAIVEAQGYIYAAYQNLIFLDRELGKNCVSKEASARSEVLKKRFNEDFWMGKKNYFVLALDGEKRQRDVVTSNPGHLLFTGIVVQDKVKPLVSRLFQSDLWTPFGIRSHSAEDSDFDPYSYHRGSVWPHDNWIIYKGIRHLGFNLHADRIKKALLRAFRELGKIPELYAVVKDRVIDRSQMEDMLANPLQAWSSAGLLEMIWDD